ncbi:MAG: carbon starvation protein A [Bacteroidales bacterium]|nr:carbon starvation protein A [Bacteroidales bacterium]
MITFVVSIALLFLGFFIYSRIIERIFGADANRQTPAYSMQDGVDYVPMGWGKIFLIQFLNIAGLGPIFGAVAGAMWGPSALLWIVFGCVFGGAVHDYLSGMISIRLNGLSIPEIIGRYLGMGMKQFTRGFTVILMVLVGAVFIMGPAGILASITNNQPGLTFWASVVFVYYLIATLLPIDKLIGRIYPLFGVALLFMAIGISIGLVFKGYHIPEISLPDLHNMHSEPGKFPIFPMMFISIACGAISGFHATQSPMMARCIKNEKYGRRVFYGAMIAEGIVAIIWAVAGMTFFGGVNELNTVMNNHQGNAAWVVNEISNSLLGKVGGILALLGVVAAPITSGDTAFRSARLIVADFLKVSQKKIPDRLKISIPLFIIGFLLTQINFSIIWRYFAWCNQTLAAIVLWTITVFLAKECKFFWVTFFPAVFMTAVTTTYICVAPEGLQISLNTGYAIGISISLLIGLLFLVFLKRIRNNV